jgi:FSR family fosmidomycin resistance protein-like MFS transporter
MSMNSRSIRIQWVQLVVLSGVHFLVDMFGNMLPAILPAIRGEYGISLFVAGAIPIVLSLAANGVQVLTGQMRPDKTRPLFLHVGMAAAAIICLLVLAPKSPVGVLLLFALGIVSGTGVAIAHPEGLRAVHTLDRIPPALSTAVFMTTGFFGFASGGIISAGLVTSRGLKGMIPLAILPVAGIAATLLSRVHLSVEGHAEAQPRGRAQITDAALGPPSSIIRDPSTVLPFWKVLSIGLPAAVSTTVVLQLTPTYLNELGFSLTFGGFSTAVFGWGGVAGPFLWAAIAHRRGDLPCSVWAFLLSAPFMVAYLVFVSHPAAAWMLFGVGFFSMSGYILAITLAREATGLNLGHRMALIVGGTWGIAMIVYLGLAAAAEWVGIGPILRLTPAGYLCSGALAFYVLRQHPETVRRRRPVPALELQGEQHPSA